MSKARNKVIAGDYKNGGLLNIGGLYINAPFHVKPVAINRKTVENIEVIDNKQNKSTSSAIKRGIVGGAIAGSAGAVIGGLTGKTKGIYQVAINFKDGKRSLVEVDDEFYNKLIQATF